MREVIDLVYKPGTDIIDIGGNIGCNALMFSDYGPVHTFEPLFHKILKINVDQNSLRHPISVYDFGLSSESSDIPLYLPKHRNGLYNYGCCSVHPNVEHSNISVTVHLERFDSVYNGIPSVMKIDVEGHEMEVLKGAENTIRNHMPSIIIEIHNIEESPITKYLSSLGYKIRTECPHANYLFLT